MVKLHQGNPPVNTKIAYAVFKVDKDEHLHSVYVDSDTIVPMNVWIDAEELPFKYSVKKDNNGNQYKYIAGTTGASAKEKQIIDAEPNKRWLFYRCGKHCAEIPNFMQMNVDSIDGKKTAMPHDKLVFEISIGADVDLTDEMLATAPRFKNGNIDYQHAGLQYVPRTDVEGFYYYNTNTMSKGRWIICSCYRVNRQLTYDEIVKLNKENGLIPQRWLGGYTEIFTNNLFNGE